VESRACLRRQHPVVDQQVDRFAIALGQPRSLALNDVIGGVQDRLDGDLEEAGGGRFGEGLSKNASRPCSRNSSSRRRTALRT
jgi:hypothetical protein